MASERFSNILRTWFTRKIKLVVILSISSKSYHQSNSNDRLFLLKLKPEFSVTYAKKSMPIGNLRTHFKEVSDVRISYSLIKENDVIPAHKI